jgi:NAD(P)-dependent dehydrogenase (short-subunit alcohol dehydrogenase family)
MGNPSNNAKGTVLVTGANGGLGSALVSRLLSTPETAAYHGIYTARNAAAAPALRSALKKGKLAHSHSYDIISLELTNLASVRTAAAMINKRVAAGEIPPIRALILNAGYLEFLQQTWTTDGFDMTFASNYLGHWLLAILLLQSMDKAGRIVVIGSESHDPHNSKSKAAFNEDKWMTFLDGHDCDAIAMGTWSTSKEDPSFHS